MKLTDRKKNETIGEILCSTVRAALGLALLLGWLLGGPIGIGTVISAFLMSPIMQIIFKIMHFVPENVIHQNLLQSFHVIVGKRRSDSKQRDAFFMKND